MQEDSLRISYFFSEFLSSGLSNKEVIEKMNEGKKPAHEKILEVLRKKVEELKDESFSDFAIAMLRVGGISTALEILAGSIIPEKHRQEVADALRQIQASYSPLSNGLLNVLTRAISEIEGEVKEDATGASQP